MIKIHLLIEEEYIQEFMQNLPKDKVKVIEEDFEQNKTLLQNELEQYKDSTSKYLTYNESMKNLSTWLSGKEI